MKIGDQQDFLADMTVRPQPHRGLPINNISMISQGSGTNAYRIIGGCFNPIFDINNMNTENTLFHSYSQSKKSSKAEFEQDIIDFIYMDFIRSISILSLKSLERWSLNYGYLAKSIRVTSGTHCLIATKAIYARLILQTC